MSDISIQLSGQILTWSILQRTIVLYYRKWSINPLMPGGNKKIILT